MADKETGLNITVGAVADESSAQKAAKDLAKGVLSSLKDGYIEVPAEIKMPIKNASKDLEKAQKDVISQWKKTFKEGFSSSEKDLDDLTQAYYRFKRLAGKEHKAGTKQYKEINKMMGGQIQSYNTQKQARETKRAEQMAKFEKAKQRRTQAKSKKPKDGFSEDTIKRAKDAWTKEIKDREKAHKELSEPGPNRLGSTPPKGFKTDSGIDQSRTNEYELKRSEISSYRSNMERQIRQSQKEARQWEKESLTVENVGKEKANEIADRAISKRRKRVPTAMEQAGELSDTLRKVLLPELLNKMKKSETDEEVGKLTEQFLDTLETISKLNQDAGRLIFNDIKKDIGVTMGTLGFTTSGNIGGTDGEDKTEASRDPKIIPAIKGLLTLVEQKEEDIKQELIKLEELQKVSVSKSKKEKQGYSFADKLINETRMSKTSQAQQSKNIARAVAKDQRAVETQTSYDKIENTAERISDSSANKKTEDLIKSTEADTSSGFNTDNKANEAIDAIRGLGTALREMMAPCEAVLQSILVEIQAINKNGVNITGVQKGQTRTKSDPSQMLVPAQSQMQQALSMMEYVRKYGKSRIAYGDVSRSDISTTIKDPHSWVTKLKDTFADLTKTTANYKKIMAATSEEQDKMSAERIKRFGLSRGRNATDNGDKILFARRWSLFRGRDKFGDLFKDINLSKGVKVDTTDITDRLAKALSGKEMFKAQTGGFKSNILGAMTGGLSFAFTPSLEKSRARAEGVNQIMANIRKAANDILQDIQSKESTLSGMRASGDLKLGANGEVLEGSTTEAKTLALQLEESKQVLASILADAGMVDQVVGRTHGRLGGIIKQLGFTSPVLRQNNHILANLNAGLDKTGKALKNQTRLAEVLNYTYRLMTRHTAQVFKNFLLQLNPITQIKKAFQDFMGYNVKWQRTMNVIKYNLRTILRPFMDWISQKLVNIIGFVDIISMKIQEAFGKMPVSLFDQVAADAEKTKEELEAAANVTAGFDELHDIGTDNSGAMDLLGDIYKPQLSEQWRKLAEDIGDLFAGLIKGDLGFGEVMKRIFTILLDGLKAIGKTIWDWFKQTAIGKWITEHWKDLLKNLLTIFLGWKLLKIAGRLLWEALFGNFTGTAIGGVFSKVGGWILKALGATAFGRGIIEGITGIFTGSGGLLTTLKSIFVGHEAITAFGAWGETLGALFAQSLVAAIGLAIGVGGIMKGFDMVADVKSYNIGLKEAGGKDEDKKSDFGGKAVGTALGGVGGALVGLAIGGPIGAAIGAGIGAIAGVITTSLAPAIEEATVKAKEMNNELLKVEQYEGRVKGAQTQVSIFDEQLQLLKQSLDYTTQSVYDQGEKLGISKTRMDELVKATQDGTFTTGMLSGAEIGLSSSLTDLAQKQEHVTEVSAKLEEAQKKLLKAQTELSIAQDIEAKNFEIAAARIEVAEAQGVYSTEEATKKRIQLYKQSGDEERKNLLQNLTDEQRTRMLEYKAVTDKELGELSKIWQESSGDVKKALLEGVGTDTQTKFKQEMSEIDRIVQEHQSFWQGVGDTLKEIFTFGHSNTWTYNGYEKASKLKIQGYATGTNYVPNDGLAYLHQGEAVIPKKYNTPYQTNNNAGLEEAINQLNQQVAQIGNQVNQGINIKGQFVQKGSDLVATVEKANKKLSNNILNNKVYAR